MVFESLARRAAFLGLAMITLSWVGPGLSANHNRQTFNFEPAPGPITNPLMGWAPWATVEESLQPHTLVYADVIWREFEPRRGVYDFASFEQKNQFDRWRAENKRVVLRFVCDQPGEEHHFDIPDWLYQATNGSGDHYDNVYGRGFSPDYTNPTIFQRHAKAIQALGERYGKDDFIAYIELGSLGHWGEWHVHLDSGIRPLPEARIRDQYVQQYIEAFPDTFLLMRRPFRIARRLDLGLYNDVTGDPDGTAPWLEWIDRGGTYDQVGEKNGLVPMPNAWRTAPIGGEQTSNIPAEELYGGAIDRTIQLLEQSHTTFIGPNGPYKIPMDSPLQGGIDRVLERMGYRIYIRQVQMPLWVLPKQNLQVTITFANDGIAPMYYNWPVQLYVWDESGRIVKTFRPEMDLRKILPGTPYTVTFAMPVQGLAGGAYRLGLAILDPHTNRPAVRLAMDNSRGDLIQELGSFEIAAFSRFFVN